MPSIYARVMSDYAGHLEEAGLTFVAAASQSDYAVCTYEYETAAFVDECRPYNNLHINHDAIDKRVLAETFKSLGFETIPYIELTSRESIADVPFSSFFSKPAVCVARTSPSSFDYVTYNSKDEAYAAFDADMSNSVATRNAIIQPSYGENGKATLMICSASVNGKGEINMEPVIMAVHKERYSHFYSAVRGGYDDTPHGQLGIAALRAFITSSGIRNTNLMLQFIDNGETFLPMDLAYRLDYHSMYVYPAFGSTYHIDRIRFAYDMQPSVPAPIGATSLRLIDIRPEVDAQMVNTAMATHNVKFLKAHSEGRMRLFGSMQATNTQAMANMDAFEAEVGYA